MPYSAANRLAITHALDRKDESMKVYKVTYKSRYYPLEETRVRHVRAMSRKSMRDNWHALIHADEYRIVKIEEAKEG